MAVPGPNFFSMIPALRPIAPIRPGSGGGSNDGSKKTDQKSQEGDGLVRFVFHVLCVVIFLIVCVGGSVMFTIWRYPQQVVAKEKVEFEILSVYTTGSGKHEHVEADLRNIQTGKIYRGWSLLPKITRADMEKGRLTIVRAKWMEKDKLTGRKSYFYYW